MTEAPAIAAVAFAAVVAGAIAFQLALAAGAPWGAYAMGGAFPGRLPRGMRAAAIAQAILLAVLGLIVLSAAGLVAADVVDTLPWLPWVPVVFSAISLALNASSRSAGERRIWVPVALVMLASSLVVAMGPR